MNNEESKTPNVNIAPGVSIGTAQAPSQTASSTTAPEKTKAPVNQEPKVEKSKKTVEVDAEVLQKLVDTVESQKQDIEDLKQAADVGRLNRIQAARSQGKLVKKAKVSTWEGKIVVGWVKVKDDVYFDESGKLHEDQQIKLFVLGKDGERDETSPMTYRTFARVAQKVEGEVIKESKDQDGRVEFTIMLSDGREVTLPIVFVN